MAEGPSHSGFFRLDGFGLFLSVFWLSCTTLPAVDPHQPIAQMHHTAWSAKEGVLGAVLAIAQTSDGFIWLGSTGGLLRFDGSVMERYKPALGSIPDRLVSALLATPDGGLWIGYLGGGAIFLKSDKVANYSESDGMPGGRVRNFAVDADGTIWAAATGGLGYFDGTRWRSIGKNSSPWGLPSNSPASVAVDKQGALWVATANEGVFLLPRGSHAFQQVMSAPIPGYLPTFTPAGEIEMWLWVPDSLSLLRFSAHGTSGSRDLPAVPNPAGMFLIDRHGSGWLMTRHDGVWRIPVANELHERISPDNPSIEKFSEGEGLTNRNIYCVIEDREGGIWVGTQGGLDRFRPRNAVWTQLQSKPSKRMQLVAGDNGAAWVSSPEALWDTRDRKPVRGSPAGIQFSFRDPDGAIWFWSEHRNSGALWRWADGQFVKVPMPVLGVTNPGDRLADSWVPIKGPVRALTRDGSGGLWLSIRGRGVFRQHQGSWIRIEILPGEPYMTAYAAVSDGQGRVWLAYPERKKIGLWDHGTVRVFSAENGLTIGAITQIAYSSGQIWAGGESGLAIYANGRFHSVELAGGSEFGMVTGIAGTSDAGLWLSTASEIFHIPQSEVSLVIQDSRHRVQYESFDPIGDSGERPSDTSDTPAVVGTDGILWFATPRGVIRVDPANLHRNLVPALVAIRHASANGKSYPASAPVNLPPHTTSLHIGYSVLSFSDPERVRSRYRLLEIDKEWHDGGNRVEAPFSNLGPGTYTLQVAARNNDGVWSEAGTTFSFTIQPAFYQTVWFRLLYVLAGAVLIRTLYRLRLRQVTARVQLRYSERLAERTRIARELHDTLLQSLAGVSLQLDGIAKQAVSRPEKFVSMVNQIRERVDACFIEARAQVWNLRSTSLEGPGLAATLREFCERMSPLTDARCEFQLLGDSHPLAAELEEELLRIAQEAVHNSIRHARANGILLILEYTKRSVTLTVSDDGRGFDVEEGFRKSDHWGLKNMQERAKQIHATYAFTSAAGKGTRVEVRVPVPA